MSVVSKVAGAVGGIVGGAGASGVSSAAAAATYAASNIFSWKEARDMPKRQAAANREVLALQKKHYEETTAEQRAILNAAIDTYLSNINALLDGTDFEDAYPDVPQAAEYVPIDACCVQEATIECNIDKTTRANDYVQYVNRLHEQNDLRHVLSLDPRFLVTVDIQSKSIQDLTRGILPVGDVVEVLSDNAEQASLMGRIGSTKRTTARDLGISKLRAQAAGRREFRESIAWANSAVSPLQRQLDIQTMMMTPQQRIQLALHQSQLIQQSLQNKNNALAQKSPYLMAKLQTRIQEYITRLQAKSSEALLGNDFTPNYNATVVPKMDNFSQLVGGIGQAIQYANSSHFFGAPPTSQDGYRGQNTSWSPSEPSDYPMVLPEK